MAALLALCCATAEGSRFAAASRAAEVAAEGSASRLVEGAKLSSPSAQTGSAVFRLAVEGAGDQADAASRLAELIRQVAPVGGVGANGGSEEVPWSLSYEGTAVVVTGSRGGSGPDEPGGKMGGGYIVEPITGVVAPGKVSGLMGPSGSGKTSLLNALAGVAADGVRVHGRVAVDGEPLSSLPRGTIGYAAQEDLLLSTHTPYEALAFAARLGLPRATPAAVRTALVEAALCALGLQRVAGRVVGLRGAGGGGLSGGERKRVSLGVMLVTAPPVLLCDEPTSGLDAFGAHSLAAVLAALARRAQRTVLLSVHQPSSQVFALLDHLTLLADGRALYRGAAADVAGFLSRAAVPAAPPSTSTADHLLYVCCSHRSSMQAAHEAAMAKPDSAEARGRAAVSQRAAWAVAASAGQRGGRAAARRRAAPGVAAQVRVLAWRACLNVARHPTLLRVQLLTFVGMAVLMGLMFGLRSEGCTEDDDGSSPDAASFQSKAGLFSFMLYFFAFAGLSMLSAVAEDWRLFWREYHAGLYRAEVHVTVKLALDLLLVRVLPALVFGAVVYLMTGLRREAPQHGAQFPY